MNSTLEYMSNLNLTLVEDYRTPDKKNFESCAIIAEDIAERLLSEGKFPYIIKIQGKLIDSINRELIIPKPFEGRVSWIAHLVCCENNLVYDPMVSSEPVKMDDYFKMAFEDEVEMNVLANKYKFSSPK